MPDWCWATAVDTIVSICFARRCLREIVYERQVEDAGTQAVRMYGNTAIVTARLWSKGRGPRGAFEHHLWFSDTYVRTPEGWRYVFGQASLPLP